MRQSERWIWRAFGALAVGFVAVHVYPRPSQPVAAPPAELRLSALRVVEPVALPDLKLWGAGPPMDLQWQVIALPVQETTVTPPSAKPVAKVRKAKSPTASKKAKKAHITKKSQKRAAKAPRRAQVALAFAAPVRDWRYDLVYERASG